MSNQILGKNVLVTARIGNADVMVGCAESVHFEIGTSFVELVNTDGYSAFKPQKKAISGSIDGLFTIKDNALDTPNMIAILDSGRMLSMQFAFDTAVYYCNFYVEKVTASSTYDNIIKSSFTLRCTGGFTVNPLIIIFSGAYGIPYPDINMNVIAEFESATSGKYKLLNAAAYTNFTETTLDVTATLNDATDVTSELQINKPYSLNTLTIDEANIDAITFNQKLPIFCYKLSLNNNSITNIDTTKLHAFMTHVDLSYNTLNAATVNALLVLLNSANSSDGVVYLQGGTNAVPNFNGYNAAVELDARNWDVEINQKYLTFGGRPISHNNQLITP